MAYRASFAMTVFGNFAVTGARLRRDPADVLAGRPARRLLAARGRLPVRAAGTAFGLADLALGSMDRLGRRVRDGTLDTLLVRPAPVLAQVAADRFALRRLGRITQGLLVLGYALAALDISWTPLKVLLMPVMLLSGGGDLRGGVRGGRGLPVRGAGRLRGAELLHVRRQHAAAVPADGLRQGPGARGDVRACRWPSSTGCPRCTCWAGPIRSTCPTWVAFTAAAGGRRAAARWRGWPGGRDFVRTAARGAE